MKRLLIVVFTLGMLSQVVLAEDLIIESRPEGKNNGMYSEPVGSWLSSNTPPETAKSSAKDLTPQGTAGSRKMTAKPEAPEGTIIGAARFSPKFEAAGKFHVYATWGKAANSTPVKYVIKHAGGESTVEVSQDGWGAAGRTNANQWVDLGQYDFEPEGGYVELQVSGGSGRVSATTSQQTISDAVRFSTEPIEAAIKPSPPAPPKNPAPQATPAPAPTDGVPPSAQPQSQPPTIPSGGLPPALPVPVQDSGPIQWAVNLTDAQAKAKTQNKKLLIFFYIDGNPRSQVVENDYLDHPRVKGVLKESYIPVRINMTTERSLTQFFQVYRAGTILLYDSAGEGIDQITDIASPEGLATRLAGH